MVRVRITRDQDSNPLSVEIKGHALFAPGGSDIVCAAVSVLVQSVLYAMEDLLGIKPPQKLREGYFLLSAPQEMESSENEKFLLLLETMLLGLKETAKAYPDHIDYKEIAIT